MPPSCSESYFFRILEPFCRFVGLSSHTHIGSCLGEGPYLHPERLARYHRNSTTLKLNVYQQISCTCTHTGLLENMLAELEFVTVASMYMEAMKPERGL